MDVVNHVTSGNQRIRVLRILDGFTQQSLALELDANFAGRLTKVLNDAITKYGKRQTVRSDDGPELTAVSFWPGYRMPSGR